MSNLPEGGNSRIRGLVADAIVHPGIPGIQGDLLLLQPGAVGHAQLQGRDAHDPVRGGAQHAHEGDEVVLRVGPEDGEGLALDVGVPEPSRLDDRPDVTAARLQLALQQSWGTPLGHLRYSDYFNLLPIPYSAPSSSLSLSSPSSSISTLTCSSPFYHPHHPCHYCRHCHQHRL